MSNPLARRTGSAIAWRTFQLAGVKVIFLARTVILARLLAPDNFGLLAVSLIAVDVLKRITNLGLVPALIQHGDADDRHYHAAWTAGVVRACAITTVVFLTAPALASLLGDTRATNLIRALAVEPLLEALGSIKIAKITRDLRFREVAFIMLPDALVNTVVSIALARPLGVWALVLGALSGQVAQSGMSYLLAPYRPRLAFSIVAAQPLLHFGRWIFVLGLVTLAGSSVLQAVIARQLGVGELGLYYLAAKLAFIPAEVSGEVIGAVAFPLYARLQREREEMARAFRGIYTGVLALLMPVSLLLIALAPALVTHVLGPRWQGSVPLIQLLALVSLIGLLGDGIDAVLQGAGHPARSVVVEAVQSALVIAVIGMLTARFGAVSAGIAWLAGVGASQLVSVALVRGLLPTPFAGLGRPVLMIAAVSGLGALLAWSVVQVIPGLLGLATAGLLSVTVIGLLLWNFDRRFAFGLANGLARAFPQLSTLLRQSPVDG